MRAGVLARWVTVSDEPAKEDKAWDRLYEDAAKRLETRLSQHEIDAPSSMAVQDLVVVYRMPPRSAKEVTDGGIIIPEKFRREEVPFSVGLLICAGAEAMDVLESHGILPGDYVTFARYAGDEETSERVNEAIGKALDKNMSTTQVSEAAKLARDGELTKKKLLTLRTPEIHRSVDLAERLGGATPTMRLVRRVSRSGVVHVIAPVIENL